MLYNQTFNLDQVAFASEGIKDAQQTVCFRNFFLILIFQVQFPRQVSWQHWEYLSDGLHLCLSYNTLTSSPLFFCFNCLWLFFTRD